MTQCIHKIGSIALARRVQQCLLVTAPHRASTLVEASLKSAGITVDTFSVAKGLRWPLPQIADQISHAANTASAQCIIGVGSGAVLDLAKAGAALAGAASQRATHEGSAAHLLGSPEGFAITPGTSLLTLLVPTTACVAATSGRVLLQDAVQHHSLLPLVVAGPGPLGVGVGLQASEVLADICVTSQQSRTSTAAAAVHAMSTFVDGMISAAGTIKAKMLWQDMASGLTSARAALLQPDEARADAMYAALAAGSASSDADANARGCLCIIHALSCVAATAWGSISFPAVSAALLPPVLRALSSLACDQTTQNIQQVAAAVLREDTASLEDFAAWVERSCHAADVPRPVLAAGETKERAAAVLALRAMESPLLYHRPGPEWVYDAANLAEIYRAALSPY